MSRSSKFLKACLGLLLLLGFFRFFIVEAHQKSRIRAAGLLEASRNMKQDFVEGVNMTKRKKHRVLAKLELINYMNKRRVPNGPDPIHNRGAGKSHRPPGHA